MAKVLFEVSRIYKSGNDESKIKAFVDVLVGGLVVKGLRIVEGEKGLFLSMPRQPGKDGHWYSIVYPRDKEVYRQLSEVVLDAYKT